MKCFKPLWILFTAGWLSGCSSFNTQWQALQHQPIPPHDITGAWDGHWRSHVNTHRGRLRAVITRNSDDRVLARFYAVYWGLFRFSYTVPLDIRKTESGFELRGRAKLAAWAGGAYEYDGTATATIFSCTYRSKYDNGIFEMRRP